MYFGFQLQIITILTWIYMVHSADVLTKLNCPSDDGTECIINCSSHNCENKLIDARDYHSFHLLCDTNRDTQSTCSDSKILCPQNGTCDLNCTTDHICNNIHIVSDGYSSNVYLQCTAHSCSDVTINASSIDTLHVTAIGAHALTQSHIYAENVNTFTLNCGQQNAHSKHTCLHNDLYLASGTESNVTLNCLGESCRGSSIHVTHSMAGVEMNIVSNCECDKDITDCANYWYLFCDEHYANTNIGYVTFRDYECLNTHNITKCGCDAMREYVTNHWIRDESGVCEHGILDNGSTDDDSDIGTTDDITDTSGDENIRDLWFEMVSDMNDQKILIWLVMGSMVFVVLLIMCYLCAMKMAKYNEIQLIRNFDPDVEHDYNVWASAF